MLYTLICLDNGRATGHNNGKEKILFTIYTSFLPMWVLVAILHNIIQSKKSFLLWLFVALFSLQHSRKFTISFNVDTSTYISQFLTKVTEINSCTLYVKHALDPRIYKCHKTTTEYVTVTVCIAHTYIKHTSSMVPLM